MNARTFPEGLPYFAESGECGVSPRYVAALRELLNLQRGDSLYAAVAELARVRARHAVVQEALDFATRIVCEEMQGMRDVAGLPERMRA